MGSVNKLDELGDGAIRSGSVGVLGGEKIAGPVTFVGAYAEARTGQIAEEIGDGQ